MSAGAVQHCTQLNNIKGRYMGTPLYYFANRILIYSGIVFHFIMCEISISLMVRMGYQDILAISKKKPGYLEARSSWMSHLSFCFTRRMNLSKDELR